MNDERCPICADPSKCRGYPALWERLSRPDGHRWLPIHDRLNAPANLSPIGDKPEYPPLSEQIGNAARAAVDFVRSGLATTTKEERERRLAICRDCKHFDAPAVRCTKCGCALNLKARIESAHCPIGKW